MVNPVINIIVLQSNAVLVGIFMEFDLDRQSLQLSHVLIKLNKTKAIDVAS